MAVTTEKIIFESGKKFLSFEFVESNWEKSSHKINSAVLFNDIKITEKSSSQNWLQKNKASLGNSERSCFQRQRDLLMRYQAS